MRKLIICLLTLGSLSAYAELGENYNMGCGEVSALKPYIEVPGVYWVELSIPNGHTSGLVAGASLTKKIQQAKLSNDKICLGLEYDSKTETNFISYFTKINP